MEDNNDEEDNNDNDKKNDEKGDLLNIKPNIGRSLYME